MTELCSRTERFEQLYYFLFISLFDVFTNADDPVSAHERETFDVLGEADKIGDLGLLPLWLKTGDSSPS